MALYLQYSNRKVTALIPRIIFYAMILGTVIACDKPDSAVSPSINQKPSREDGQSGVNNKIVQKVSVKQLFLALTENNINSNTKLDGLLSEALQSSRENPHWPTLTYLAGEINRQHKNIEQARQSFRALAEWGISDDAAGPYGDTWGGSGLSVLGLWRWLQLIDQQGAVTAEEIEAAFNVADSIQETRFYSGMIQTKLLAALPLLEEDIAERLAHIAWKNNKQDQAVSFFLDFLSIISSATLKPISAEIKAYILSKELADPERLELYRNSRILNLTQSNTAKKQAAEALNQLWQNPSVPVGVRNEAGYKFAVFNRRYENRDKIISILSEIINSTEASFTEKALYQRGKIYNRGKASTTQKTAFRNDMITLIKRFPSGERADNALYQLATDYLFDDDLDNALLYYGKLQTLQSQNDYQDSAYFMPALGLIARGQGSDLADAKSLLNKYIDLYPQGVFRLRCLFWKGRIAEQEGKDQQANELFESLVNKAPYDYYGIRARMHIEEGINATLKDLPGFESQTRKDFHQHYINSHTDSELKGNSAYHKRIKQASNSGLYRQLIEINETLDDRLDNIPLQRLDDENKLVPSALLLSFRQDAIAARDIDTEASNWLQLSSHFGQILQDWPMALAMLDTGNKDQLSKLENNPGYLATAYPSISFLNSLEQPMARSAWLIDHSKNLSGSLMYSVIRHESRFYPKAISKAGALGLFQFMPYVFKSLENKQKLPQARGDLTVSEYLLNADKNISLWASWVQDEFSVNNRNGIAMALIKHQAGSGNLKYWQQTWEKLHRQNDLEFQIETARFSATRYFVKRVLRDMSIVDAAAFFDNHQTSLQN